MAHGTPPPTGASDNVTEASPDGLNYVFEIAKNEVDTQFRIAERLDAKARGLFALAGAIFAVTQALALRQDVLDELSNGQRDLLVGIAIAAGVMVGLALLATAFATFVKKDKVVESGPLFGWLNELAERTKPEDEVAREAVEAYITLMHRRREQNDGRAKRVIAVEVFCVLAIAVSVAELVIALIGLA